ncbi:MAG: triose-phosphate isomerase [Candidatus Marinimicrobia bacterium]|nr:triose-phosphate isomerase [Candidatus Neomarinimicrobiota bacterium]
MKKLIVANWKMNPQTTKDAGQLAEGISSNCSKMKNVETVVCPPFVYLDLLSKFKIKLGAQDVFWGNRGSFTGEISSLMLKDAGVKYVIIGHSERRAELGETNDLINKKIKTALKNNLKVIFCIGEKHRDEKGDYLKFVKKQLLKGLEKVTRNEMKNLMIAYEPVWAISSNKNAQADTAENLFQMSVYIRRAIFLKFGRKIAKEIPILYGGSVNEKNAKDFLENGKVQGLLVGKASLSIKSFSEILKSIK